MGNPGEAPRFPDVSGFVPDEDFGGGVRGVSQNDHDRFGHPDLSDPSAPVLIFSKASHIAPFVLPAALTLAACAPGAAQGQSDIDQAVRATVTAMQGGGQAQPDSRPSQAPRATTPEAQIDPEELKMKEFVLNEFLNSLNKKDTKFPWIREQISIFSQTSTALESFPKREILQGINVRPDSGLIALSWITSVNGKPFINGQAEMKGFKIESGITRTDEADRANRITKRGSIGLTFLVRVKYATGVINPPEPTIEFSPWEKGWFGYDLIVQDGQARPNPSGHAIAGDPYPIKQARNWNACRPPATNTPPGCQYIKQ